MEAGSRKILRRRAPVGESRSLSDSPRKSTVPKFQVAQDGYLTLIGLACTWAWSSGGFRGPARPNVKTLGCPLGCSRLLSVDVSCKWAGLALAGTVGESAPSGDSSQQSGLRICKLQPPHQPRTDESTVPHGTESTSTFLDTGIGSFLYTFPHYLFHLSVFCGLLRRRELCIHYQAWTGVWKVGGGLRAPSIIRLQQEILPTVQGP